MVDLPETIFEEAARAARWMEDSDTGLITVTRPGEEIPEGLVAEVLTMVANNTAHLSIPPPQVPIPVTVYRSVVCKNASAHSRHFSSRRCYKEVSKDFLPDANRT